MLDLLFKSWYLSIMRNYYFLPGTFACCRRGHCTLVLRAWRVFVQFCTFLLWIYIPVLFKAKPGNLIISWPDLFIVARMLFISFFLSVLPFDLGFPALEDCDCPESRTDSANSLLRERLAIISVPTMNCNLHKRNWNHLVFGNILFFYWLQKIND